MQKFTITELAGREVAGMRNPGAGETITLSEKQARHPLRLGHIKRLAPTKAAPAKRESKPSVSES